MLYEITEEGKARPAPDMGDLDPLSIKWTEVDMQYVLGLNPELLGVADHLAVGLDGGNNERMSDQLYVDELGRATIVELKSKAADLDSLAQLLSYADHERQLPAGELERRYLCAQYGWTDDWRSRALACVRSLAQTGQSPGRECASTPAHDPTRMTFEAAARKHWGELALVLKGAPPRSILVTKDGTSCADFTARLQKRYVNVRLFDADLRRSPKRGLVLDWNPREPLPQIGEIELMWEATRYLWRDDDFIPENFAPNGWAEHRYAGYVSFSARRSCRVRFYLRHEDSNRVRVEAWVPDKWCTQSERTRLTARLNAHVPEQSFSLPEERDEFVGAVSKLARVLLEVLLPSR